MNQGLSLATGGIKKTKRHSYELQRRAKYILQKILSARTAVD